ncbi:MAG: sulfotransferase domain-containing protein [Lewinellaceae bacterium]|nr:sulfotransferase domain-containing protein [Lewinellaceae bacterium]
MQAPLPTFIICGAPKAGTTSLYHYLSQHPEVCMSSIKETDFFQHNYGKGLSWFKSLYEHYNGEKAIGEVSPGNMITPEAPQRIHDFIPDAKLIFILRDPIDRIWSHFQFEKYRGLIDPVETFAGFLSSPQKYPFLERYKQLGFYYNQLKEYQQFFSPEQMLILQYEDFKEDPTSFVNCILGFIGVNQIEQLDFSERKNTTKELRFKRVYSILRKVAKPLKYILTDNPENKLWWSVKSGIRDLFLSKGKRKDVPDEESIKYLISLYKDQVQALQQEMKIDVSKWRYLHG